MVPTSRSRALKLSDVHESPGDLVKNADSASRGLGRGPGFCVFNKLPGDVDAAGLTTTL